MLIKVKIIPGSRKTEVVKKKQDEFLITVKERPEKGRANKETFAALADYFNLSENKIRLIKGFKKRNKVFEIIDL